MQAECTGRGGVGGGCARDEIEERIQRLDRLVLQEGELIDQLLLHAKATPSAGSAYLEGKGGRSSCALTVHFSARVVVEMGEGSFCRKLP